MQQLLGDHAGVTDGAFLRELFLQRLPSNVRMVLASTSATTSLKELAEVADEIVEVATPTMAATTSPQPFPQLLMELEQLRTEVRQNCNGPYKVSLINPEDTLPPTADHPALLHPLLVTVLCWYQQKYGEAASANLPALTMCRQTSWPAIRGDKCVRPSNLLPIAHY